MKPHQGFEKSSVGERMAQCFQATPKKLRIRGTILFALGLIIAVGIFMVGKSLPTIITTKIKESMCISSVQDKGYVSWLGDETDQPVYRQFRVYIWNITNKNRILYHGEIPKLKEVGPYIYRFGSSKHDVHFNTTMKTVRYKAMTQIKYDQTETSKHCPNCNENDKMTVANLAYTGLMLQTKGDTNFALSIIPKAVSVILQVADAITGNRTETLKQFGSNTSVIPKDHAMFSDGWAPAEFGKWVYTENSKSESPLKGFIQKNDHTSFSVKEMKGLYDLLQNPLFLGTGIPPTVLAQCKINVTLNGCGFLFYLQQASARSATLIANGDGGKLSTDSLLLSLTSNMQSLLCSNTSNSCFILTSDRQKAIAYYITQHLIKFAIYFSIDSHDYGPIISKTIKELVSGFTLSKLKIPGVFPNGVPVKGFLPNDTSRSEVIKNKLHSSFFTCEAGDGTFKWFKFKGQTHMDPTYFPGSSESFRKVKSNSIMVGASKALRPCMSGQSPNQKSYFMFQPQLFQKLRLVFEKSDLVDGIFVNKFLIDQNYLFGQNNISVYLKGIIDMQSVFRGIPMLYSMPHFFGAEKKLSERFNMKPSIAKHQTYYNYEPISGAPVSIRQGLQINTVLPSFSVSCPRHPPFNITYTESMKSHFYENIIPVYWMETYVTSPENMLAPIKQAYLVLKGSCACMALGPLTGTFLGFLGAICILKSWKTGRVQSIS